MQQYFELVNWQGHKPQSAERRQRDSLKILKRSVEVWKDWIHLKKEFATLGEELPPVKLLPANARNKVQIQRRKTQAKRSLDEERLQGATRGIRCHVY